jgi:hypothetical protein
LNWKKKARNWAGCADGRPCHLAQLWVCADGDTVGTAGPVRAFFSSSNGHVFGAKSGEKKRNGTVGTAW